MINKKKGYTNIEMIALFSGLKNKAITWARFTLVTNTKRIIFYVKKP